MDPRYGRAFETVTTVVLGDGAAGFDRDVFWRAYGKTPHLIADAHMQRVTSPADQNEWPAIREAAIARHYSLKSLQ